LGLTVENVSKNWPGFSLRNISLTAEDGEYLIILGPMGAGKTLLLETIMGFYRPDTGRIILDGKDITDLPTEKRRIGYVSQTCALFPHLSVRENIEFGLIMHGVEKTKRKETVDQLIEAMQLKALERRRPTTLSGGEKQKVAIARVLAIEPKTILLDEPLTAVDDETKRELKNELKRIHETGKTILHVTHDQIEGFSLGDRMAIIKSGEIVQTGKAKEIFAKPKTSFVARFLGYENIFKAKIVENKGSETIVDVEGIQLRVSGEVKTTQFTIAIRPEDINVGLTPFRNEDLNILEGNIIECVDQGPMVAVKIDAGLVIQTVMTRNSFFDLNLQAGQKAWLAFGSQAVKIVE